MSDWQWFEEFEQAALAQGDRQRANLRQIHRDAYSFSETDPERALALLAEGRPLALTLQEPWWVLLFDHWQVHITLYDKCDYRNALEPAVRNVLQVRKPQYTGFPQKLWILGDLIQIYVNLDPRGYADEIDQALAELKVELTPQTDNARYLFWFHQLDAAANQDRVDDALQIALRIGAAAQADPVASTGKHYLVPCYRALCHFFKLRRDWLEVATWVKEGETLAEELVQKQPVAVFRMWQAVVSQQRGEPDALPVFFAWRRRAWATCGAPRNATITTRCAPITNFAETWRSRCTCARSNSRISTPEARFTTNSKPAWRSCVCSPRRASRWSRTCPKPVKRRANSAAPSVICR